MSGRLAIYNLQWRDSGHTYSFPWAVCRGPMPSPNEWSNVDLDVFRTLGEAMDWAITQVPAEVP
jgi:hypothetical protein